MSRFTLAGLLRLRQVQEDRAAADLGAAERDRGAAVERAQQTADRLAASHLPSGVDSTTWLAAAASRLSLEALLDEDAARVVTTTDVAVARRADWTRARQAERTVERLEEHHEARELAAELSAEQRVLDEVAGRRTEEER